jgi:hypothetical protein
MVSSGKGSIGGKDYAEKLDRLLKFLYDVEQSDLGQVKETLAEYGIGPEDLVKEGLSMIKSLEKQEKVKLAQVKRKKLAEVFQRLRSIDTKLPIDAIRSKLDEIFRTDEDSQLRFAFHKLDSLGEEALRDLLSDAQLLKGLEEELGKQELSKDD